MAEPQRHLDLGCNISPSNESDLSSASVASATGRVTASCAAPSNSLAFSHRSLFATPRMARGTTSSSKAKGGRWLVGC
jgi:hypothetical protein